MPANLTPQYLKAEEKYRRAQSLPEQIACLEAMLQAIPKHKGTDRLQGDLRARLKEARAAVTEEQNAAKSGKSWRIPRQGAGTAVLIGAPNSGKSRLLKELTSAAAEVAPYPFTTREPQAGMMAWEDLKYQLIDTPPIAQGTLEPYLLNFIRSADLVVLCLDGSDDEAITSTGIVLHEVQRRKTRLGTANKFDEQDFATLRIRTLGVVTRGRDPDTPLRLDLIFQQPPAFPLQLVDLDQPADVAMIRNEIAAAIPVMRIYTRKPGQTDRDPAPIPLPGGSSVEDLAAKIHLDLAATLKFAKVWSVGHSAPRTVQRTEPLQNLDLVELYI